MSRLLPIKRTSPSFFERARRNADLAAAREAERNDPVVQAVARARAASYAVSEVRTEARKEWDRLNVPMSNPLGATVHPQVAALVVKLMAEHGIVDPTAPVTPTPSIDELAGELLVEARRLEREADDEVVRLEAERDAEADPVRLVKNKTGK